jgi:GT2 family glycosyltransferase/glycosyltransferase involved in cell wall biosynthesis
VTGIVLLNWNNEPDTRRALESLRQVTQPAHRVYVVDNGSVDGSMDRIEAAFRGEGHVFLRNAENLGFSGGCNVGIRRALDDGADSVLLLNNDCIVRDGDMLAALVRVLAAHPQCGAVGGKILRWPDTGTIWSTGGFVSPWRQRYVGADEPDRGQHDRLAPRTFLSGALMLVRREVFAAVGLLSEDFFFGHEDWEFGTRVTRAGFALLYTPESVVYHAAGQSHDSIDPLYVYNAALSRMLYQKRTMSPTGYALWRGLYGFYLHVAEPVLRRLRPARFLRGLDPAVYRACFRAAFRDIEWLDRVTPRTLERYRERQKPPGTRPIRVAHVVATSDRTGVEAHLRVLFEGLRGIGHDPYLVCPLDGPLTEHLRARGFEVRLASPRRRLGHLDLHRLRIALEDCDLVHNHGPRTLWWHRAMSALWGTPPAVATVHQLDLSGLGSALKRWAFRNVERLGLRAQQRVIAVSRGLLEEVIATTGVRRERARWVPASSELLLVPPRAAEPARAPREVVVVARLHRVKGVDVLLEAWARLEDTAVVLRIYGDGPERPALEAQARALGLAGRVRFEGACADAPSVLRGASVYAAPSRSETFGIAVLEAMTLGLPVVATAVFGHRDLLGEEFASWLVPVEDPGALARGLARALALAPAERADLAAALAARARAEFSPARMAERTAAVYVEALADPASR